MNILVVDNGTHHLQALLNRLNGHDVTTRAYGVAGDWGGNYDLIVLTGGHKPVLWHTRFYRREMELIRSSKTPIIGICLGHEIIARAFGVRPTRLRRRIRGIRDIRPNDGLITGRRDFKVYEAHKYALAQIPSDFESLAHSHAGVELMRHFTRPIVSMQFHPEVTEPRNDGMELFGMMLVALVK